MSKKQMPPLVRTLCVVLGLIVAEATVPVLLAQPFASHEGEVFKKARAQYLKEDHERVIQVFKAFARAHPRVEAGQAAPRVNPDDYRLALAQAAQTMKTDMGALSLRDDLIEYLAAHPDDKEMRDLGLALVDRGLAYNKDTFTPIYERFDRIDTIFEFTFPAWFYRKELLEAKTRVRTTVPKLLNEEKAGIQNPQEYLDAEHQKKVDTLRSMTAQPSHQNARPQ